jgi:hypothetical protein
MSDKLELPYSCASFFFFPAFFDMTSRRKEVKDHLTKKEPKGDRGGTF